MTDEGNQTVRAMSGGNSLFVTGMVVGVAMGIAAGHFLLFGRGTSVERTSTAEEEFSQLVAKAPRFAAVDSIETSEDPGSSILEFDGLEAVGRVRLSDQKTSEEHLHYFPEALEAPQPTEFAHSPRPPSGKPLMTGPLQMTAETSQAGETPPQALPPSPTAAPIDKATSDRQSMARTIIQDEMPHATAQEREIWLDVLQGLPAEDIKGILRMRKHIGSGGSLKLPLPLAMPTPLSGLPAHPGEAPSQLEATEDGSIVRRHLQQISRHNLANRSTVGFKQQIPVVVEASVEDPTGLNVHKVIRDMRQGELESTGRPLDVALSGPGFLQVRRDDEIRFTRDGRLTLDDQGRLQLLAPADAWLIEPPIVIPRDACDIAISEQGVVSAVLPDSSTSELGTLRVVQFLNPSALQTEREGLYESTDASGRPRVSTGAQAVATLIVQGHLERSNTTPAAVSCGTVDDAATSPR